MGPQLETLGSNIEMMDHPDFCVIKYYKNLIPAGQANWIFVQTTFKIRTQYWFRGYLLGNVSILYFKYYDLFENPFYVFRRYISSYSRLTEAFSCPWYFLGDAKQFSARDNLSKRVSIHNICLKTYSVWSLIYLDILFTNVKVNANQFNYNKTFQQWLM